MLADASVFMSCAMVLAVFDISKYSENGVVFELDTEHTAGTIRYETHMSLKLSTLNALYLHSSAAIRLRSSVRSRLEVGRHWILSMRKGSHKK